MRAAQRKGRAPRAGPGLAAPRRVLLGVPRLHAGGGGHCTQSPPRTETHEYSRPDTPLPPPSPPGHSRSPRLLPPASLTLGVAVLTAGGRAKRSRREPIRDQPAGPAAAVQPPPRSGSVAVGERWRHPHLEPGTALVVASIGTDDLRSVSEFTSQLANKVRKRCLRVTGP